MIRSVRLDRLPEGVSFPAELSSKIAYSAENRQLQFTGFMSKTDFDKLVCLHNDLHYQRALEQLFQKCTFQPATPVRPKSRKKWLLAGAAAAALLVVAIPVGVRVGSPAPEPVSPVLPDESQQAGIVPGAPTKDLPTVPVGLNTIADSP